MKIKNCIREFTANAWALGFVCGGMDAVMDGNHKDVEWVKMPKDRWFADPFILDVTDEKILLLVEDYAYASKKGVISLLHINRTTMEIAARKELLELSTHLSFPAIWRKEGRIYVYPESAKSGKLDLYEYDSSKEELTYVKTICDEVVWDSYITEAFGDPLMFTAANNDYQLDIYKWDETKERFFPYQQIASDKPNSRMGGAVFEYKGEMYYPAQNCEKVYGGAIDIKRIVDTGQSLSIDNRFSVETVKHIESPNKRYPTGLHTMNEYKGVVVIDVKGYRFGKFGAAIAKLVMLMKNMKK